MGKEAIHPPTVGKLRRLIRGICEQYAVARMDVFGSVARGTATVGSDVDLLVEFSPDANVGLFEMGALKEDLEERLGCEVDLMSHRAAEQGKNPIRRRQILEHRVNIYAR